MTETNPGAHVALALAVPLTSALGAELLDPSAPESGVWFVGEHLADNGAGGVHAAALAAIMEVAGFLAVAPTLAEDEHAVTHASAFQLITAAPLGQRIEAVGQLERRARHVAFVSVVATVGERVLARGQLTKSIVRARAQD